MDLFRLEYLFYFFPRVLEALPVTLLIVFVATIIGTIVGLLVALIRIERIPVLSQIAAVYVSFIRGTPIYIQIFIVYFGIPMMMRSLGVFGYQQDQMLSVYVAYGLNVGAFFSETFRSAIQSVPAGQKEAAMSIGQTKWEVNRRIVLPQAIRIAIPSIGAQIVGLLQNTSLAFSIGIIDMIGKVRSLAAIARRSLEGYIAAAIIFVVLSILLEQLFTYIEKKTAYGSQKPNLKVKTNVLSNN